MLVNVNIETNQVISIKHNLIWLRKDAQLKSYRKVMEEHAEKAHRERSHKNLPHVRYQSRRITKRSWSSWLDKEESWWRRWRTLTQRGKLEGAWDAVIGRQVDGFDVFHGRQAQFVQSALVSVRHVTVLEMMSIFLKTPENSGQTVQRLAFETKQNK